MGDRHVAIEPQSACHDAVDDTVIEYVHREPGS